MLISIVPNGPFTCINCGKGKCDDLYRVYGSKKGPVNQVPAQVTHLTLTECPDCGQPVDNYIELDNCILCLDGILLKMSFFRHCLLNCQLTTLTSFKLFLLFILCDSLFTMSRVTRNFSRPNVDLTYYWFELIFYSSILVSLVKCCLDYLTVLLCFNLISFCLPKSRADTSMRHVIKCLIFSSYFKLFNIILALWTSEFEAATNIIVILLQITSLSRCVEVLYFTEPHDFTCLLTFLVAFASRSLSHFLVFSCSSHWLWIFTDTPLGYSLASYVIPSIAQVSELYSFSPISLPSSKPI